MGWIRPEDMMPPEGLQVLLEVSGLYTASYGLMADHSFMLGTWIVPDGSDQGEWLLWDNSNCNVGCDDGHICDPTVHAWMPLPKHFEPRETFPQDEDRMEHSMFVDDPEWLYKDNAVYEQMSLENFLEGGEQCKHLMKA